MLNPDLDQKPLVIKFATKKRVRIQNVLRPEHAEALATELAALNSYSLLCATAAGHAELQLDEVQAWPQDKQEALQTALTQAAQQGIGYSYLGFRMSKAWADAAPDTALGQFYQALNGPDIKSAITTITGRKDFNAATPQASQYHQTHYLTRHLDDPENERRRLGFVWGFTKDWHPDWGGLLQFFTPEGEPTEAYTPQFNTLDIFEISHVHSVTYVTPFAGGIRSTISGWFVQA